MKLGRIFLIAALGITCTVILSRCSKNETTKTVYASTSTTGDFAQWTVEGNNLNVTWQIMDTTGGVKKILTIAATCGAADETYVYKTCTVSSSSCTNGTSTCAANDAPSSGSTFYTFEIPGTAFMVKAATGSDNQLHVGYVMDTSCSGVAGDYTFQHLGNKQKDLFGLYRVNADMSSLVHADFGVKSNASCVSQASGACTANDQKFVYTTGNGGTGVESITSSTCDAGVRTIKIGSNTLRAMQSQSGVFILDLPSGQGGIVAFKTTAAATLADFANKNFAGIAFPDNGSEQLISAVSGAVSGVNVPLTTIKFKDSSGTIVTNPVITAATNNTSTATGPAFPDNWTGTPVTGSFAYSTNTTLAPTYPTVSSIPGLFRIDGTYPDAGRVIMMATKVNGKVIAFGEVYNWRNGAAYTSGINYYNTGAFILFEK